MSAIPRHAASRPRRSRAVAALAGLLLVPVSPVRAAIDFQRDVRPILNRHCFPCHGPDEDSRKAKLRLDRREFAVRDEKADWRAIVPGRPDQSPLVQRIEAEDAEERMPPAAAKKPLDDRQKAVLRQWVAEGAPYTAHWAFQKPVRPALPPVKRVDWPRNPIDFFVLNRLEREGLEPSPEADPVTLLRRVYLDLIGLPPTPEEVDAFLGEDSPEAYERVVDRLLASPHYGERWARRWMDLARYADSNGYEKDRERSIWPWRDWLIQALNDGMPFDQFTLEQMAGDLLPGATLSQRIATGFHRNTMINEEGGNDPLEFRFYAVVDRVKVTGAAWLGLTLGCAQCHSHKFDPITQRDYYRFTAFLNNADEPWIEVPDPEITRRRAEQQRRIDQLEANLENRFPAEVRADWLSPAQAAVQAESGVPFEHLPDGSWLALGTAAQKDVYTVKLEAPAGRYTHLQLQALPDGSLPHGGPGRSESGNFVLSELSVALAPLQEGAQPQPIRLARADADFSQAGFAAYKAIDDRQDTGWAISGEGNWHLARNLIVQLAEPLEIDRPRQLVLRLHQQHGSQHLLGRWRLALGRDLPDPRPMALRRREHLDRQLARWIDREQPRLARWKPLEPQAAQANVPTLTIEPDQVVFASGDFSKRDIYTVTFHGRWDGVRALRLEVLPDPRLPADGPGRVNYEGPFGNFFLSDFRALREDTALPWREASDSFHEKNDSAAMAIDDDMQSGWSINGGQGRTHNAVFVFKEPLEGEGELQVRLTFEKYYAAGLGKFRIWATRQSNPQASDLPNDVRAALLELQADPTERRRLELMERLRHYYLTIAPELAREHDQLAELRKHMPRYPTTLVLQERPPGNRRPTYIHHRGEFLQAREKVEPGVPKCLPPLPPQAPRNRLGLAQWLVSRQNPLTARVVMNRAWQAFFGRGIVRTLEDFGSQGDLPSHPKLLDWLAVEFMDRGWSMKQMHRLIVTSATYRQSSRLTPDRLEKDPENVLLSRGPRFRLDVELIRDSALVASGLLSPKLGGPSVFPPQLPSITTEGAYRPFTWRASQGEDRYRRSLYTFAKRTAPFAMYATFDAPSGETCVDRRERSNTPLQALTLLNDEMFLEMARALGRRIAAMELSDQERLQELFRRCLARRPDPTEQAALLRFYRRQLERFRAGELDPTKLAPPPQGEDPTRSAEVAAWTTVARVLMNLDEFITKS